MQASTEEVFEALGSTLRSFHVGDYSSAHSGGGGVGCCGAEEQRNLNSFAKMSAARDPRYDSNSSRLSEQLSPPLEQSFRRPLRKAEPLLLVDKSALDALEKFSVKVLEPVGEPFDPEFHEAMTMVPSETAEPNTVLEVLQKGYTLNGRTVRAAMVVVSSA